MGCRKKSRVRQERKNLKKKQEIWKKKSALLITGVLSQSRRSNSSRQEGNYSQSFVENLALAVKMLEQVNLVQRPDNPAFAQSRGGVCLSCGADGNAKEEMGGDFFQDKNSRQPMSHNMTSNNSLEQWNKTQQNFSAMNCKSGYNTQRDVCLQW